jgi:hypothetical protein
VPRDQTTHSGIPTEYKGITMRSRLEARWACVLDLLGLPWEYEPIDLDGYIPDFIVTSQLGWLSGDAPGTLLIEVRPLLEAPDWREPISKIARSGWRGAALVVGAVLPSARSHPGAARTGVDLPWWPVGYGHPDVEPSHAELDSCAWLPVGWRWKDNYVSSSPPPGGWVVFDGHDIGRLWIEAGNRVQWQARQSSR